MVRSLVSPHFKSPWPFVKKGRKGWRKIGPNFFEEHKWPGQNKEFPELSPKINKENPKELHNYTNVQPIGYFDPDRKKFIKVPEMVPKLIVPDLTGFKLKPYVSFRTDVEIESRSKKYNEVLLKKGSKKAADLATSDLERWPPPKMDSKTLFDLFYAEKVKDAFLKKQKQANVSNNQSQLLNQSSNMRLPFFLTKKSFHTSVKLDKGPLKFPGWYPRDHKPNPFPTTEEERRTSAINYGLRPEDYRTIDKDDVKRYCGDYPDLGIVTFAHKDPYEDYSNRLMRRNWNEPVSKDYMLYRPDRVSFTGLDTEQYTKFQGLINITIMLLPIVLFTIYAANSESKSIRWKNPVMPKQYPYDMNRAWPVNNPCLYPIENYSFESDI